MLLKSKKIFLMNKYAASFRNIILFMAVFHFTFCIDHQKHYAIIIYSDFTSEGFLNRNIFQVKALGDPDQGTISIIERRKESIKKAYYNGIERSIDLIIDEILKKNQAKYPEYELEVLPEFVPRLRAIIRKYVINGKIVRKQYTSDGSCSLIYRVEYKNLKKLLLNIEIIIRKKIPI